MDRHDGLALLQHYHDMSRPDGPFRLGDTGELNGIQQMVIGIVGVVTYIEGEAYRWTDYQLYSPTHGYSWLTWNNNHAVHSRRVRGDMPPMDDRYRKETFPALGRNFSFFESYESQITYLEGELTWQPQLGDKSSLAEAISPPFGFSSSDSGAEIEHSMQTYIPRDDLIAAFGLSDDLPRLSTVHPTQPFLAPFHRLVAFAAVGFAALSFLLYLVIGSYAEGHIIAEGSTDAKTGALTMTFES